MRREEWREVDLEGREQEWEGVGERVEEKHEERCRWLLEGRVGWMDGVRVVSA